MAKETEKPRRVDDERDVQAASSANRDGIDFLKKGDAINMLTGTGDSRLQPMHGFLPEYTDIVDYIVRSTHRMWEEGGIGLLYQHYSHNTVVWSEWGVNYGRDRTFEYVIQRESAFPDLRLYSDDVIWAGNDREGFRTSHRITQIGHNYGPSKYGPATRRRIQFRSTADCIVRDNRIIEEWLAHDEMAVVRQLGLDVDTVLREITQHVDVAPPKDIVGEIPRVQGQTTPLKYEAQHPDRFDVEDFVRLMIDEVWNWRLLNRIPAYYASNVPFHGPAGRELYSVGEIRAWVLALLAAFPDLMIHIDDLFWNGGEEEGYRVAVRWHLSGTHRGVGIFGRPTGRQVHLLGSSQYRLKGGKIAEEWTFFNELALLWKLRYA